ncbi:pneumococcal serine-rich repeat protein-like [Manduca sexta]|uniref:pneumococcal serine-rich repeat protein-like n=1 Tax=Manduca sexta TaxID=7130 RepID=UPI00188F2F58|nr:pneumococcal serine-rich repeat protein-like [Manduca sexta]
MPVTRSTGRRAESASVTATSATATSATATSATATSATVTGTTEATEETIAESTATHTATLREAAPCTAAEERPAAATEQSTQERARSKTASSTKHASRARRLAQARAELTALKIELAAAKLAEIEAEDSEDDLESVITEAGQDCRVHSWVQTSQLLAIESRPTDVATGKQAPIQSSDPVIAAVSWDNPATVPAGAMNPTAQPEVPTIEAASWQRTQQATQPPPVIAARSDEHRATKQPPPVVAAWLRDNSASQQPQSTPNPQQVQDGALVASRPRTEYQELASAITQAVQAAQHRQPLRYTELPTFNGDHHDWLTYRAAYIESMSHFTTLENMSRLRRSLRGIAKEAVQGLLITNADPNTVLKSLETNKQHTCKPKKCDINGCSIYITACCTRSEKTRSPTHPAKQ